MGIEEILSKLRAVEGVSPELVQSVESAFSSVNGEAAGWRKKLREAEARITRLNELIGEGDKDAEQTLKGFKDQIDTLTKDKEKLEGDLKTANEEKDKAVAAKTEQEKVIHFTKAATRAGADVEALSKLLPELTPENLVIEEGDNAGVFVTGEGGKKTAIADYAKEKGEWVLRAIFPSEGSAGNDEGSPPPRVPFAPANNPPKAETSTSASHLKRNFPLTRFRKAGG